MRELHRPTGLIAYDNDMNADAAAPGLPEVYNLVRPRTILYVVLIAVVGSIMTYAFVNKKYSGVNVLHDRNPLAVRFRTARCAMAIPSACSTRTATRARSRSMSRD